MGSPRFKSLSDLSHVDIATGNRQDHLLRLINVVSKIYIIHEQEDSSS